MDPQLLAQGAGDGYYTGDKVGSEEITIKLLLGLQRLHEMFRR